VSYHGKLSNLENHEFSLVFADLLNAPSNAPAGSRTRDLSITSPSALTITPPPSNSYWWWSRYCPAVILHVVSRILQTQDASMVVGRAASFSLWGPRIRPTVDHLIAQSVDISQMIFAPIPQVVDCVIASGGAKIFYKAFYRTTLFRAFQRDKMFIRHSGRTRI